MGLFTNQAKRSVSSIYLIGRSQPSTLAPTLIEADSHLFPSITSHLSPNSCYHQSPSSINLADTITTAVIIKHYNQSSH